MFIFRNQANFKLLCEHFYTILHGTKLTNSHYILDWPKLETCLLSKIQYRAIMCYKTSCLGWEHQVVPSYIWACLFQRYVPYLEILIVENQDLIAIKKLNTMSVKTIIYVFIAVLAYQSFGVQGCYHSKGTDDAPKFQQRLACNSRI